MKIRFAFLMLLTGLLASAEPRRPKALLLMLDGVRADAVMNARTPVLDSLRDGTWAPGYHGVYSDCATSIHDAPPNSAPNHVAIATGVTAKKHLVSNNGKTSQGAYQKYPSALARLKAFNPKLRTLFAFGWSESGDIAPGKDEERMNLGDSRNANALQKVFAQEEVPDATYWYIDLPDNMGHGYNFYPSSPMYLAGVSQCDYWLGKLLTLIKNRRAFDQEDWLIMITSDHGGYHYTHGLPGENCHNIPIIMASRHLKSGRIPGRPGSCYLPVTILDHFKVKPFPQDLDGKVINRTETVAVPRLAKELVFHESFDEGHKLALGGSEPPVLDGDGRFGRALRFQGTKDKTSWLEGKPLPPKGPFTICLWVRMDKPQPGDSLLVSNKDWADGRLPGFALTAARQGPGASEPGIMLNVGCEKQGRRDIGQMDVTLGKWMFIALVRRANKVVYLAQGHDDGNLYFIADDMQDAVWRDGEPVLFGQDGTRKYQFPFVGAMDDVAFWNRALDTTELQKIYKAGCQGMPLADLLGK